ncbi:MAG: ATP-binding protein [Lachnospiraceae bacterium]|nr:ATP-binding protein [Lachnospiraceae bacterium]
MGLSCAYNKAKLTIINTNAHIDEKDLPHLFEAFYRADRSARYGSGLGLYITRMILETYQVPHSIENTEDGVKFTAVFST